MILDAVIAVLRELGMIIERARWRERAWKDADPCKAATFHCVMASRYRPIRWFKRWRHSSEARYWYARCDAEQRHVARVTSMTAIASLDRGPAVAALAVDRRTPQDSQEI